MAVPGSKITGSGESGAMVCGPAPGMLKAMVSPVLRFVFASPMASRSEPLPESPVVVTVNVVPATVLTAKTFVPNSEVLPNASVAVAVMKRPGSAATGCVHTKLALPLTSVVTFVAPR